MTRINGWACFFLVTLRLVIGWHFFIEGMHKIHSHQVGKTSTNTPWTSEGFFREGYGPAAEFARKSLGISDHDFANRFDDATIFNDLSAFKENVERHYRLSPNQSLATRNVLFDGAKELSIWKLDEKSATGKRDFAWGSVEMKSNMVDRVAELDAKTKAMRDIENSEKPALNSDVEKARIRSLKAEIRSLQSELATALDGQLTKLKAKYLAAVEQSLTDEQKKEGLVAEAPASSRIAQLDKLTMWSHAILGGLLMLGLFTRLSSVLLALFLLSVTLIAPALPWAPSPSGSTGHYLYINLYTIEMIALLALTFLPTGKWFGVDALFVRRPRPTVQNQ